MSPSNKRSVLITGYVKPSLPAIHSRRSSAWGPCALVAPLTFHSCSQGGTGNALALGFAAQGLRVFATARSLKSMSNLAENGIETLALDVTAPESIVTLKDEIAQRTGGKLDILYNNAGSSKSSMMLPSSHNCTTHGRVK